MDESAPFAETPSTDEEIEEWVNQYALLALVYLTKAISTGLTVRLTKADFDLFESMGIKRNALAVTVDPEDDSLIVSLKKPDLDA